MHYLEKELRELNSRDEGIFRFIEEGSLDGIWYWDLEDPENEWMSPKFWRTFSIDPLTKEHLVSEWQDLIHKEDLQIAVENFQKHSADSSHPYDQYVRYWNEVKGDWTWVRCRGKVIRDEQGKPIRMLGAHVDVTDIKCLEASLKKANDELMERNEELMVFAHAASHDLQSPIKSMLGILSIMEDNLEPGEASELAENIQDLKKCAEKARNLTQSVLMLGKSRQGAVKLEPTNLVELTKEVWKDLDLVKESGHVDSLVSDEGVVMDVDRGMFRLLLTNLFSNSLKYKDPLRPLAVRIGGYHSDTGEQAFLYEDNGIGMSEEQCLMATDLFLRFANPEVSEGAGLGLGIVKQIVKVHGLHLTLQPNKPHGLRIIISKESGQV